GFGAEALVRVTSSEQLGRGVEVEVEPLALQVRAFVPVETEPPERVLDADDPLRARPRHVGVFDAEHEHAVVTTGIEPVEQRCASAADVERARRRGREPDLHHYDGGERPRRSSDRSSASAAGAFGGWRRGASGTESTTARRTLYSWSAPCTTSRRHDANESLTSP